MSPSTQHTRIHINTHCSFYEKKNAVTHFFINSIIIIFTLGSVCCGCRCRCACVPSWSLFEFRSFVLPTSPVPLSRMEEANLCAKWCINSMGNGRGIAFYVNPWPILMFCSQHCLSLKSILITVNICIQ